MQTTFARGNGVLQNISIGYYDAWGVCTVINDETEAGIAAVITILRLAGGLMRKELLQLIPSGTEVIIMIDRDGYVPEYIDGQGDDYIIDGERRQVVVYMKKHIVFYLVSVNLICIFLSACIINAYKGKRQMNFP